jgi:hypothetical protein
MITVARSAFVGVLVVLTLAGCGRNGDGAVEATPGQTTGAGVPAQPTQNPVAGVGTDNNDDVGDGDEPDTVIATNGDTKAPDHGPSVAIDATFRMPDVRGKDLQAAQDVLQGLNSYELEQKDATGRGRNPVRDTTWRVCGQSPAPGRSVPIQTVVRLSAVKDGETCP